MASHNAKDPMRREMFILKQLKHLPVWRGILVHESLSNYFVPKHLDAKNPENIRLIV
jgi:hypothetical protein